jgi:hypothetical protein
VGVREREKEKERERDIKLSGICVTDIARL